MKENDSKKGIKIRRLNIIKPVSLKDDRKSYKQEHFRPTSHVKG